MDSYILEAYRKKTGRKYIETCTVMFSRDGKIANNLIFWGMCVFYFFFFCFSHCPNDYIVFVIRKRQCLRNKMPFFAESEVTFRIV